MDADQYFHRIASGPVLSADLKTLCHLQQAHLRAVPFENLDIRGGLKLALNEAALFEKIVTRWRGGICYELNTLFAALLRTIGFQVSLLAAEVAMPDGTFGPSFDHMALFVVIGEQRFLADVGFGDSFLEPLDLDRRGEQSQDTAAYEVRLDGPSYVVMKRPHKEGGAPAASFRFQLLPRKVADFEPMCLYHQTSAESHFTRKDICSKATRAGRITISGDQLIETRDGSKLVIELQDSAQRGRALRTHFGVVL
jgi:N-hydroxyarylamine O-acetyltransferase